MQTAPAVVEMRSHGSGTAPPPGGKIVLSALPAGESTILAAAPSIKLVIEGEEIHQIDGRSYSVRPGQMLLVDRGAPSRAVVRRNHGTLGLCVYLPGWIGSGFNNDLLLPRAIVQATESSRLGRVIAEHARRWHQSGAGIEPPATIMAQIRTELDDALSHAALAMDRLKVRKASTRREIYHRLETARAYLHGHIDRTVPLDELATVAGLSGFHLTRYFSAAYGAPPARYHRTLRLERAADRLRRTGAPVTEIALEAGYAELSAFSHAFRREFGCSPRTANRPS